MIDTYEYITNPDLDDEKFEEMSNLDYDEYECIHRMNLKMYQKIKNLPKSKWVRGLDAIEEIFRLQQLQRREDL